MIFPAREVAAHVKNIVSRSRFLYPTIHINRHDWDDITQGILIHVSTKWGQHKGDKWRGWVTRITHNQVTNKLRDRINASRRMPTSSMTTRLAQLDDTGDEVLVYEPDMIEWKDSVENTRAVMAELPETESKLLYEYVRLGTWEGVGRVIGTTGKTAHERSRKIAARVKALI